LYEPGKPCKGIRLRLPHYFFSNPNATPNQKYAENLGYCGLCWMEIPNPSTAQAPGWFEKKYPKRNDRADIMPSKDYE
jgi:hypothetical protein